MNAKFIIRLGLCGIMVSCDPGNETEPTPGMSRMKIGVVSREETPTPTSDADFLMLEDRLGLWINSGRRDTLKFLSDTELQRRGPNGHGDFLYRIQNSVLYIVLTGVAETQHPILQVSEGSVKLNNMYATIGFLDNSGAYFKQ